MFSSNSTQVSSAANYIEDVFSTYLYTGNSSTQTITNGIDLSTKGGLVWIKTRTGTSGHALLDTARGPGTSAGATNMLSSDSTNGTGGDQAAGANDYLNAFTSSGFSVTCGGGGSGRQFTNSSGNTYASWTFRKQPKFFDVVTYTGDGNTGRTISHNLGSTPGCIIIKCTSTTTGWRVYHKDLTSTGAGISAYLRLDSTAATQQQNYIFGINPPTSTNFGVGSDTDVNASGQTYVAYIFAHNAGGFGLTGTDNVISCGSFTASAVETAEVTLGYEPQWLLFKPTSTTGDWQIVDIMRPWPVASDAFSLKPNLSSAEANFGAIKPNATGFYATSNLIANATYIYIAIRRGPMKVPTDATKVFTPVSATPSGATTVTTNFPVDLAINKTRSVTGNNTFWDRLRGSSTAAGQGLFSNLTNAEVSYSANGIGLQSNTSIVDNFWNSLNGVTTPVIYWNFRRAPGFFDEVCYTGDGTSTRTVNHNLGVAPELLIAKRRATAASGWFVYLPSGNIRLQLNSTAATPTYGGAFSGTTPTATTFSFDIDINGSGDTYVTYLFASCPGVSKVGSYTGTGATQTISCGFTGGARFVLIKRTDTTGDWYVWDSARGMVAGTDPSLLLNSTAAEVNANSIYTTTGGFQIVSTAAGINASGGTYIYLSIA